MSIIRYNSQKSIGRYSCDVLHKKVLLNLKAERLIIKVLTTKLKTIGQKYWEKIQIAISLKKKKAGKIIVSSVYPKENIDTQTKTG